MDIRTDKRDVHVTQFSEAGWVGKHKANGTAAIRPDKVANY